MSTAVNKTVKDAIGVHKDRYRSQFRRDMRYKNCCNYWFSEKLESRQYILNCGISSLIETIMFLLENQRNRKRKSLFN